MEHIHLNMIPDGIAEVSHASQFDNGRQIRFNIFNDDSAYTLDGTETITMVVNGVEEAVANTSDNYVVWDVDASDCEEGGVIECELRIVKGGVKIGSKNFFLAVETDPYGAGSGIVIREAVGDPAEFTSDLPDNAVECKIDIDYNANGYLSATVINSGTEPAFDSVPYVFRKSGGDLPSIGGQEFDTLVGGSVAFNQLVQNGNFESTTGWSTWGDFSLSVNNNVLTATVTDALTDRWNYIGTTISGIVGHKYYLTADIKSKYPNSGIDITNTNTASNTFISVAETWTKCGTFVEITSTPNQLQINVGVNYQSYQVGDAIEIANAMCIDLTQMLGAQIADYIYTLETSTPGAGVAFFRKLFGADYYAYDSGSLLSVKTSEKKTTGANLFNKANFENLISDYEYISTANYKCKSIQLMPNAIVTISQNAGVADNSVILLLNNTAEVNATDYFDCRLANDTKTYTLGSSGKLYIGVYRYVTDEEVNARLALCNIMINFGSAAEPYEPYTSHSYPLDSDLELCGIPKLDTSNKLYYDGDTYESNGSVTRKYGIVDLGSLEWIENARNLENTGTIFYTTDILNKKAYGNAILSIPVEKSQSTTWAGMAVNTYLNEDNIYWVICADYPDAATFTTAMSGKYLVYELATPTTETADTFTNPQQVDANGTEEYVDNRTVPMPVGHMTAYGDDIKGVIVDFGHLIYGGELNLTTGTLTSTKNADGTDKVTPDVYHLTPKQVEVREGNNKIFGNTNGNTYVKYYARA